MSVCYFVPLPIHQLFNLTGIIQGEGRTRKSSAYTLSLLKGNNNAALPAAGSQEDCRSQYDGYIQMQAHSLCHADLYWMKRQLPITSTGTSLVTGHLNRLKYIKYFLKCTL